MKILYMMLKDISYCVTPVFIIACNIFVGIAVLSYCEHLLCLLNHDNLVCWIKPVAFFILLLLLVIVSIFLIIKWIDNCMHRMSIIENISTLDHKIKVKIFKEANKLKIHPANSKNITKN